jgi:hypothetical protein
MTSRSFGNFRPGKPHLLRGGRGIAAEILDLRNDVDAAFENLETYIDETFATSGQGYIYLHDAEVIGGSVSNKDFQDINNTVLQSFTASSTEVRLSIISSYPEVRVVTLAGDIDAELERAVDESHYSGEVDITVDEDGETISIIVLTPEGSISARQDIEIAINLPPEILSLYFTGDYPELSWDPETLKTALAANDTFQISFTSDKPCIGAKVLNQDACILQTFTFAETTSGTITATIANRGDSAQFLPAWVQLRDSSGAYGSSCATNHDGGDENGIDVVNLNNLAASGSIGVITYRSGYSALKNSEYADIALTASNYNEVLFDDNSTGELSITNTTIFEASKEVLRLSGDTRFTGTNFRMRLRRTDNGRETIINGTVQIAHIPISTVIIGLPAARLRSGGNNGTSIQNHTISVTLDQPSYSAPSLDIPVDGGIWSGDWSTGPSIWTRILQVHDDNAHQLHTWGDFSVLNKAGLETTVITSGETYTIGGSVQRIVRYTTPFSQEATINVPVSEYTKLVFGLFSLNDRQALRNATQGNHDNITDTITVDEIGENPTTVFLNDLVLANQNSLGLLTVTIEETV